jgi:hypothetical protein
MVKGRSFQKPISILQKQSDAVVLPSGCYAHASAAHFQISYTSLGLWHPDVLGILEKDNKLYIS